LARVCANCHRMIHRRRPWLRVGELSDLVALRKDASLRCAGSRCSFLETLLSMYILESRDNFLHGSVQRHVLPNTNNMPSTLLKST
jgi:hypothetical protein